MLLEEGKLLGPCIEPPYVAGTLHDQVHAQDRIDDVVVHNEVVPVFDKWPIHMRRPIHQQERHRDGADIDL